MKDETFNQRMAKHFPPATTTPTVDTPLVEPTAEDLAVQPPEAEATPEQTAPDLSHVTKMSDAFYMVDLSRGFFRTKKLSKKAQQQLAAANNADLNAVSGTKDLLAGSIKLANIETFLSAVYTWNKKKTLDWLGSIRLLSNLDYPEHFKQMDTYKKELVGKVDDFMLSYKHEVTRAEIALGDLFDPADYPPEHEVRRRFYIDVTYVPMPADSNDKRQTVSDGIQAEVSQAWEKFTAKQSKKAMDNIWQELAKTLGNMIKMVDYSGDDKPTGFRGTLVSNVEDVMSIMRTCNITKDIRMEKVRLDLRKALDGVTPDQLRNSEMLRMNTKDKIKGVINNLPSLGI